MTKESNNIQGITGIKVRGFKSHRDETEVEVRPLTVLAGANSAGKSSVMQPSLMLKQTVDAPFDPGYLKFDGPNVNFSSADQFLWRGPGEAPFNKFQVELTIGNTSKVNLEFERKEMGVRLNEATYVMENGTRIVLREDTSSNEINSLLGQLKLPPPFPDMAQALGRVVREKCFFHIAFAKSPEDPFLLRLGTPAFELAMELRRMIHLPGLRGNPQRNYSVAAVEEFFPGLFQDYVASLIASWQEKNDPKLNHLNDALRKVGMTWKVSAVRPSATTIELRIGRTPEPYKGGGRALVNIADVGFGVSQSLPVLVALIAAQPGQLVYIEQPEIHLHPNAQRQLVDILADTVKRGARVVIEIHSGLIVTAIRRAVARGQIKPEDVKLYWFKRDKKGASQVQGADLDSSGAYGEWPADFDDINMDEEKAYREAAFERLPATKS